MADSKASNLVITVSRWNVGVFLDLIILGLRFVQTIKTIMMRNEGEYSRYNLRHCPDSNSAPLSQPEL